MPNSILSVERGIRSSMGRPVKSLGLDGEIRRVNRVVKMTEKEILLMDKLREYRDETVAQYVCNLMNYDAERKGVGIEDV